MARQRISSTPKKKIVGNAQRKETTIQQAYSMFAINQKEKGNSKPTLAFYDRSYKKLALITEDGTQLVNETVYNWDSNSNYQNQAEKPHKYDNLW